MDEKMFELMSKLYSEMQEGFTRLDNKIDTSLDSIKQDLVRLENKVDNNHKALYDGYAQNTENLSNMQQALEKLTDRVEHQEIKLQVVKGF